MSISFNNFFQVARDEERIKNVGKNFCDICDNMVATIMPYIKKVIEEVPEIKDDLRRRDAYLINIYTERSRIISIIDKILIKNFENYKRLPSSQIDTFLDVVSDRLEGANLGFCNGVWHRSRQYCWSCRLNNLCTSKFKNYNIKNKNQVS
ncbi:MAG: hypothetical protein U9O55_04705 [Patescibacteria group bacterium]|nr:hypothetical protein [Patescibacteria group bacterium]